MWGALAASIGAWLNQLTAATRGQTILVGHGVRGGKAMIETLRWRYPARHRASCLRVPGKPPRAKINSRPEDHSAH